VDENNQQIRLYYHGVAEGNLQLSKVAVSQDGLHFNPQAGFIGTSYMRVFELRNKTYGLTMPGFLYRSNDGLTNFEVRKQWLFDTDVRHSGIWLKDEVLYIFFSRVGDTPEQILYTKMNVSSDDWDLWKAEAPRPLLKASRTWEGGDLAVAPSIRGEIGVPVNQLRDPDIFEDEDGSLFLLYSGAGEQNIGIAELIY
jgi:hypothetical protein